MVRIITILIFVLCTLSLKAQTNVDAPSPSESTAIGLQYDENTEDKVGLKSSEDNNILSVPPYQQTEQWRKYLSRRKCGWILLGAGVTSTFLGTFALLSNLSGHGKSSVGSGLLFVGGCLSTISSIPVLISAYYYRHKAKSLKIGLSTIPTYDQKLNFSYTPAVSFSYTF